MDKREDSLPPEDVVIADDRDREHPPRETDTELDEDDVFRRQGIFAFVHRAGLPDNCGVRAFP